MSRYRSIVAAFIAVWLSTCGGGSSSDGGPQCTSALTDAIYFIDDASKLIAFRPAAVGTATNPFSVIKTLTCPASATPVTGFTPPVVPYALSVGRDGFARVLYTSGELFRVSVADGSCSATTFMPGQNQGGTWNLFGLAFSSSVPGSADEQLFVAGGNGQSPGGLFGAISLTTLLITQIGNLPVTGDTAPSLAGTGDAKVFAFFPGSASSSIRQLNRATGAATGTALNPGGLGATAIAWAFAQHGGAFYLPITTQDSMAVNSTIMKKVDATTGNVTTPLSSVPFNLVAGGSSTCAPTVPPP